MALKDISLGVVGGTATFILTYDDVTGKPQSIRIDGSQGRAYTLTLLDYVTEAPVWSRTMAPGDGTFALPTAAKNVVTVTTKTFTSPVSGATGTVIDSPKYRIDPA